MARHKTPPGEKKTWWENLTGLAGAVLAIGGVAGGIYQLVLPRHAVTISVVPKSWISCGRNTQEDERTQGRYVLSEANTDYWPNVANSSDPRYIYEFEIELRNTGNRAVSMGSGEKKPVYVCANVPRRPGVLPPSIEIVTQKGTPERVSAASMLNNLLQVNIEKLPLFGRAVLRVRLLSPIKDLGGVNLISDDPLITVDPPTRDAGNRFNEIILFNNLLPAKPTLTTEPSRPKGVGLTPDSALGKSGESSPFDRKE